MYNSNIDSFTYRASSSRCNSYPTWFHQESIDKYLGLWPVDALKLPKKMKYSTEKEDEISCSDYMNAIGYNMQI